MRKTTTKLEVKEDVQRVLATVQRYIIRLDSLQGCPAGPFKKFYSAAIFYFTKTVKLNIIQKNWHFLFLWHPLKNMFSIMPKEKKRLLVAARKFLAATGMLLEC